MIGAWERETLMGEGMEKQSVFLRVVSVYSVVNFYRSFSNPLFIRFIPSSNSGIEHA